METKQENDIGKQLQEAVLKAAMPEEVNDELDASGTAKKGGGKQAAAVSPLTGAPVPKGRAKGTPNKMTTTIRDAVMQAFSEVGGPAYLVKLAKGTQSDRAAFTSLLNKVLPTQVNANVEGGVQIQLSWLGSRSIGTTVTQNQEQITQVVDLQKDSAGKYRIIDQVSDVSPAAADGGGAETTEPKPAGDAQGA
jgi:hypothetical protein